MNFLRFLNLESDPISIKSTPIHIKQYGIPKFVYVEKQSVLPQATRIAKGLL